MLCLTTPNPVLFKVKGVEFSVKAEIHKGRLRYYINAPDEVRVERTDDGRKLDKCST